MPLPEEVMHRLRHMKLSRDMAELINGDILSGRHSREMVEIALYVLCYAEDLAHAQHQEIVTTAHWRQALQMLQSDEADVRKRTAQRLRQRQRRHARKAQKAARQQTRRHH
jgi:hypothetical protein